MGLHNVLYTVTHETLETHGMRTIGLHGRGGGMQHSLSKEPICRWRTEERGSSLDHDCELICIEELTHLWQGVNLPLGEIADKRLAPRGRETRASMRAVGRLLLHARSPRHLKSA